MWFPLGACFVGVGGLCHAEERVGVPRPEPTVPTGEEGEEAAAAAAGDAGFSAWGCSVGLAVPREPPPRALPTAAVLPGPRVPVPRPARSRASEQRDLGMAWRLLACCRIQCSSQELGEVHWGGRCREEERRGTEKLACWDNCAC